MKNVSVIGNYAFRNERDVGYRFMWMNEWRQERAVIR